LHRIHLLGGPQELDNLRGSWRYHSDTVARIVSEPLRVGVVGTGFAATCHLDALRRLSDVRVTAVAGSSHAKARRVADMFGVSRAVGKCRDLVADAEIDAIHNCTPDNLHME